MDPHAFKAEIERIAPGTRVIVPQILKTYDLESPTATVAA